MKLLFLAIFLISLSGCARSSQQGSNSTSGSTSSSPPEQNQENAGDCPSTPTVVLQEEAVETIELSETMTTQSGIAKKNKSIAYRFDAKAKQKFDYQTDQDLCVWLYTPDMTLLDSGELPQDGAYIIQITTPHGSTTFDLAMGLDIQKSDVQLSSTSSSSPSPSVVVSPTIQIAPASPQNQPTIQRTNPAEFVKNHYILLNQRQYQATWNRLSPNFQKIAKGYTTYVNWWQKVREIKIGEMRVITRNEGNAIVDANLRYVMNTGKSFQDSNRRIYLIWNDSSGDWLINQKKKP